MAQAHGASVGRGALHFGRGDAARGLRHVTWSAAPCLRHVNWHLTIWI